MNGADTPDASVVGLLICSGILLVQGRTNETAVGASCDTPAEISINIALPEAGELESATLIYGRQVKTEKWWVQCKKSVDVEKALLN